MSGNHDLGYKQLFAHPEMVRDLLAGFTDLECFLDLEVGAFERVNASYVSEQFSERHGDMVWKVRLSDHVIYVYLLLEFQSRPDRWMALRMQVYVGLLYQDLLKRHELDLSTGLPPVVPVVFYSGASPWNASDELRRLVAQGPQELSCYQASQRYLLIDQRSIDPAALARTRNLVAVLLTIELSESSQVLMDAASMLGAWLAGEEQATLLKSILGWIGRLEKAGGIIPEVQQAVGDAAMGERFQRRYGSLLEGVIDIGRQQGLAEGREAGRVAGHAEGRAEGREEGRILAKRAVLKRLLVGKFGEIGMAATLRIDSANDEDLERWIDRVLDAPSIDTVLTM